MIIHALDRLFALILIVVLLFVVPTYYRYQRQEDINYQLILLETQKTADLICELGYVEDNSLSKLYAVLGATGTNYQVTLIHMKKQFIGNQADDGTHYYYEGNYNYEIFEKIRMEGKYGMDLGDFFYISVENTSKTPFQQLKSVFGIHETGSSIITRSGGLIRAEGL